MLKAQSESIQVLGKQNDLGEKTRVNENLEFLACTLIYDVPMYIHTFSMLQNQPQTWCKNIKQLY